MTNTIRDAEFAIKTKLGDIPDRQLSRNILLSTLMSTINRLIVELNLSSQNWLLKSMELSVNGNQSYKIPERNFGTPILVENVSSESSFGNSPIEIVNANNINVAQTSHRQAVTFYMDEKYDRFMKFSYPIKSGKVRVWFEPDVSIPKSLDSNIPLQNLFFDYLVTETSYFLIDYVKEMSSETKAGIRDSLGKQRTLWATNWDNEINRSKSTSVVVRQPFRAGR